MSGPEGSGLLNADGVLCVLDLQKAVPELRKFSGDHTGEATPDPIPNSEVKLTWADGTSSQICWESRTLPDLN